MPGLKDSRNGGNGDCENTNDNGDGDTSTRTLPGALDSHHKQPLQPQLLLLPSLIPRQEALELWLLHS